MFASNLSNTFRADAIAFSNIGTSCQKQNISHGKLQDTFC